MGDEQKELVFRSGRVAFLWSERDSFIRLVTCDSDGVPDVQNPIWIEAPPSLKQEAEAFTLWACEYLGVLLADKAIFTTVSDPVARGDEDDSFSVAMVSPSGGAPDLPKGTVLTPVPEAAS